MLVVEKRLIINADDFGMNDEVNVGTKEGVREGIITSVSVMTNMPYFDDAIKFLKRNKKISVGLHFNITEGGSVLPPKEVSSLIREDDKFFYWPQLITRSLLNNLDLKQVEKELKAQYDKLASAGLEITHIDSHHHIHLYPPIFKIVSSFADKHKINSLRGNYFNSWNITLGVRKKPIPTQFVVNALLMFINLRGGKRNHLYEINRFYDINWGKKFEGSDFVKILENLPSGTTEFICHLAVPSELGNPKFLNPRFKALKLLERTEVKKHLVENGIILVPHRRYLKIQTAN